MHALVEIRFEPIQISPSYNLLHLSCGKVQVLCNRGGSHVVAQGYLLNMVFAKRFRSPLNPCKKLDIGATAMFAKQTTHMISNDMFEFRDFIPAKWAISQEFHDPKMAVYQPSFGGWPHHIYIIFPGVPGSRSTADPSPAPSGILRMVGPLAQLGSTKQHLELEVDHGRSEQSK